MAKDLKDEQSVSKKQAVINDQITTYGINLKTTV
jgi:hypothetical protein